MAIIDLVIEELPYHAYRIDCEPACMEMFRQYDGKKLRYHYLNTTIT